MSRFIFIMFKRGTQCDNKKWSKRVYYDSIHALGDGTISTYYNGMWHSHKLQYIIPEYRQENTYIAS